MDTWECTLTDNQTKDDVGARIAYAPFKVKDAFIFYWNEELL